MGDDNLLLLLREGAVIYDADAPKIVAYRLEKNRVEVNIVRLATDRQLNVVLETAYPGSVHRLYTSAPRFSRNSSPFEERSRVLADEKADFPKVVFRTLRSESGLAVLDEVDQDAIRLRRLLEVKICEYTMGGGGRSDAAKRASALYELLASV